MTENELKFFIDAVISYFSLVTGEPATMGIPYVRSREPAILDFTGLIGISGPRKGGVYFTSGPRLLTELTTSILGTPEDNEDTLLDLVGELTNTLAGNVRKSFGPDFLISVPMLLKGRPDDLLMRLRQPAFVIPLQWRRDRAFLVVGLE